MTGDPISYGDPLAKCLHLAFERDFGGGWRDAVVRRVFDLWVTWGGQAVRVTDRRPQWWPGSYGTVVVAVDLPGGRPGFACSAGFWLPVYENTANPQLCFALAQADPLQTAAAVAHEAGHGAGLAHDGVKGSLMNGDAVTPSSRFTDAHKFQLLARTKGSR